MIARTLLHLLRTRHPVAVDWLNDSLDAESSECLSVSGGSLQLEARRGDQVRHVLWDDNQILHKLEGRASGTSIALAWVMCKLHDILDETDSMLRAYVKSSIGLTVEPVPFVQREAGLVLRCSLKSCSGSVKKVDEVVIETRGDDLAVLLPVSSSSVRDLLLGRLRRTVL